MNALNGAFTTVFDWILTPLEFLGDEVAIILASGIFGILALICFKYISSQDGIRKTKDKIKAHMIEIRLYQDDLPIVTSAVGKVLLRNFQYLGYNFGPILPLLVPFTFVAAQLVTRYAFEPVPLTAEGAELMPGQGTMLKVEFQAAKASDAAGLKVHFPEGVKPISKLARIPSAGLAYQEFVATHSGNYQIELELPSGERIVKEFVAGDAEARMLQGERVSSALEAALWPAEDTLDSTGSIAKVSFAYPKSDLGWLPFEGEMGVLLIFLIASMAFGAAVLKPLGISI